MFYLRGNNTSRHKRGGDPGVSGCTLRSVCRGKRSTRLCSRVLCVLCCVLWTGKGTGNMSVELGFATRFMPICEKIKYSKI